jgi:arabinose-5-phosphate isomerase
MKSRKQGARIRGRVRGGAVRGAPPGTLGVVRSLRARPAGAPHQERARRVLEVEGQALLALRDRIDETFDHAVELMAGCQGKVVVTGVGKSGLMCRKIAATLASTGTPAIFLHSGEGSHGDAGMLAKGDVVLMVSYSGETPEVVGMLPLVKRLGLPLIAIVGRATSTVASAADAVLDIGVSEEACPLGLAPTTSTTATVALGDALALALLEYRGFRAEDFAVLHPAGALGRRLLLRVTDLMHRGADLPLVAVDTPLKDTLIEMTSKRLGVTGVCDGRGELVGVITDGDLRRGLERVDDVRAVMAGALMTKNPKTIAAEALAAEAVAIMERHAITSLFIVEDRRPIGVIHLHDLLRAGVV